MTRLAILLAFSAIAGAIAALFWAYSWRANGGGSLRCSCPMEGCVLWVGHAGDHTSKPYWPRELRDALSVPMERRVEWWRKEWGKA